MGSIISPLSPAQDPSLHFAHPGRGWATHLEHEVFVEVGIKVGEVITARRAPPLAPLVGKEAHSEKGDSFVIAQL